MRPHLSLTAWWPALVLLLLPLATVWAAGTPAGTVISNVAIASYKDANGNVLPPVSSNEVTTTVAQVAGADVSPAVEAANLLTGGSAVFYLEAVNIGNGPDILDLSTSGVPAGWTAVIYADPNGNGILDPEERTAENMLSEVSLEADELVHLLVEVTAPDGAADGAAAPVILTATSRFDPQVSDSGTYTATVAIAVLTVLKQADPQDPQPGDVVTYAIRGENSGTSDAYNVVITDPLPPGVTYVPGSIRFGLGADITYDAAAPLTDADDEDPADFGITAANTLTVNWGDSPAAQAGAVFLRVTVDEGLPSGSIIDNIAAIAYETAPGTPAPPITSAPGEFIVAFEPVPEISIVSQAGTAESGGDLNYSLTLANEGNGADVLNINTSSTAGFDNEVWVDANGDGIPGNDGDFLLTDTDGDGNPDTGQLAPGESQNLIIVVSAPPGTADGTQDITTVTVTSNADPTVSASVTLTTTVKAPVLQLLKSVSPEGSQPPGQVLTYTVVITNNGQGTAKEIVFRDPVPANTTYLPNSITVDGGTRTDAQDGDNAFVANREVVVNLGTMGPAGSHVIVFSVTID